MPSLRCWMHLMEFGMVGLWQPLKKHWPILRSLAERKVANYGGVTVIHSPIPTALNHFFNLDGVNLFQGWPSVVYGLEGIQTKLRSSLSVALVEKLVFMGAFYDMPVAGYDESDVDVSDHRMSE
ncbi:hypothetical protein AeMF1_005099 [Aphanomyces euteiches]|nr:hypothetical protein AeMF1_005099 [Aphanomyces euteiches]